ncbi:MAG: DUF624 domain-containing protein [Clostridiales bacterium]|nr:DUF624 domain-containing protein [Clostridiales bacterium]
MHETFNQNNPAMRVLSNVFNIFWVNLLFIFTCIPIITIGPSLCGLYKVCLKIVSGDDPQVYQTYFREFKASFKKGLILWLGILVLGTMFGVELYFIYFRPDVFDSRFSFLQYPVWIMIFVVVQVFLYGFALLSTFENTLKKTIINAILLSIKNFAITIFLIAVWLFTPLLINTFPDWTYAILGLEVFYNLALRVLICSFFLHKAFGLKRLRVFRDGSVQELSYDDDGNTVTDPETEEESGEETDDAGEDEQSAEGSDDSDEEQSEDTSDEDEDEETESDEENRD